MGPESFAASTQPRIVHQDDGFLIVDKPAGWSTQAPPGGQSVESFVRERLIDQSSYLTAVHRLDRETCGLLILACNRKSARLLGDQFATGKVHKIYRATVEGEFPGEISESLTWVDYLMKVADEPRGCVVAAEIPGAKRAETRVEVIARMPADAQCGLDRTRLKLEPLTGRMHQLRIQTSHRGYPIVGDKLYGNAIRCGIGVGDLDQPMALEAHAIEFHHPKNGRRIRFERTDG
jgi:RluA family pseudouridine synthase